jgi:hypothetical protein
MAEWARPIPAPLGEIGCQVIVKEGRWRGEPDIQQTCDRILWKRLEAHGCRDIVIFEPEHRWITPAHVDALDGAFEPFWGWAIDAVGVKDG